jgi:HdeA/HdeB family protein
MTPLGRDIPQNFLQKPGSSRFLGRLGHKNEKNRSLRRNAGCRLSDQFSTGGDGLTIAILAALAMSGVAKADPVDLSTYADANGFIDVQALTCGQLANTYQEDANALTSWYSGWYNGLAHKHFADFKKGRVLEHQVIEYCKQHPEQKIIHAIGLLLKEDRAEGLMMEK